MNTTTQAILIGVFVIAALAFRVYRQTQERRWSIRGMWVAPLIFLAITIAVVVYDGMQTWIAPIAAVFGLVAGVGVGLYQGTHTTLRVDRPNRSIYVRTTPLGALLFVAVLALRLGLRLVSMGGMSPQAIANGQIPQITTTETVLSSALLALALGSIVGLRWYIQRAYDASPAG